MNRMNDAEYIKLLEETIFMLEDEIRTLKNENKKIRDERYNEALENTANLLNSLLGGDK